MKKIDFFFLIKIFFIVGCNHTEYREPLNTYKKDFLNKSVSRNIEINKQEEMSFLNIIEKDSKSNYNLSDKGFWFKIVKSSEIKLKPKTGDDVKFLFNIFDLNGNDIYKDDNSIPINYVVDKEEVMPALRYGIKELKAGETGIFLMPSFLCYGYQGDGEKIIPNQPLILEINLISLVNSIN
tara:strand:+ start:111 stop:653 length:543 start_codon:yes stop_codon:yes gene_type:complete